MLHNVIHRRFRRWSRFDDNNGFTYYFNETWLYFQLTRAEAKIGTLTIQLIKKKKIKLKDYQIASIESNLRPLLI